MKYVWKAHDWYDSLHEPFRLLLILFLALPIITPAIWVKSLTAACVWFAYLVVLLGSRIYYVHRR